MLTINLLQALPRTPLWDRLQREGRLDEGDRESNVRFHLPYDTVLAMWRECMGKAYAPAAIFARYRHQTEATYPNRIKLPNGGPRTSWRNIRRGLVMLRKILWQAGVRSEYRREFWRFAAPLLARGDLETVIRTGLMAHHMIVAGREAGAGRQSASHYTAKPQLVA
jgi:hypothetical protein